MTQSKLIKPIVTIDLDSEPELETIVVKSSSKKPLYLGDISITAFSLTKGTNVVLCTDSIKMIVHSGSISKSTNIIRFRNQRTNVEFAKLSNENSHFISTLIDQKICSFTTELIYAPSPIKFTEELILNLKVHMDSTAFITKKESEDSEDFFSVQSRKTCLNRLFNQLGLIEKQNDTQNQHHDTELTDELTVSGNDLARIYSKSFTFGQKLSEMMTPPGMKLKLRGYQAKALHFMYSKELSNAKETGLSPLWKELTINSLQKLYYSPYSGELSDTIKRESHCQGGILAAIMLGKTIEILSLVHTNRSDRESNSTNNHSTLIICPLNLISQWKDEVIRSFDKNVMSVELYYGTNREHSPLLFSGDYCPDIVITSYGTLSSEYDNMKKSPIYKTKWFRVVLDEAHLIKEKSTKAAKACYSLEACNRWCVTGTPIINKLEDLYSIIRFLRVEPWNKMSFWKSFVTIPFQSKNKDALDIVQTILEPLLIRRTKDMTDENGKAIVVLPPKEVKTEYLEFTQKERGKSVKLTIRSYSRKKLDELRLVGKADYLHIFALLTKLRQVCNHPNLLQSGGMESSKELDDILKSYNGGGENEFMSDLVGEINRGKDRECPTGLECVLLPCLHLICKTCIDDIIAKYHLPDTLECPMCRKVCTEKELLEVLEAESKSSDENSKVCSNLSFRPLNYIPSSKLNKLLETLESLKKTNPEDKIIVFSQWTKMLDVVGQNLAPRNIQFTRLDGTLNHQKRDVVLQEFQSDKSITVLLASLRSTGVGLNLTIASRVFLLDPWWNSSVENQAIDRVHRIGQTKSVFVTRYIMKDSVEEKMLAIQERKSQLVGALTGEGATVSKEELLELF
ncbi:SNF2 family N-terminal domain-containing protein [Globomyces pollinis-pini]|nr:SNF2 family N-terminal domain-containing protein [Globomyces pollinis-pini]